MANARDFVFALAALCEQNGGELRIKQETLLGLPADTAVTYTTDAMNNDVVIRIMKPTSLDDGLAEVNATVDV